MNDNWISNGNRRAAVAGLAVVGFVALIGAGMWLAVYAARFVPDAASGIGAAAVYLSSVFTPAPSAGLSVVPNASTTLPFGDASTTATTTIDTPATSPTTAKPVTPATKPGPQTSTTTQISGPSTPALHGLPDLTVSIEQIGYLASTTAESFVASSTVPHGARPAVVFVVKNIGTNATGAWHFSAVIPTATAYVYQSALQQSLNPGESIEYTLGFDQANPGSNQTISINVNYDHSVAESDTTNDGASATITVLGS